MAERAISEQRAPAVKVARQARLAGRPASGANAVGAAALVDATCALLRTLPPEKISRAAVAREAKADPALINYHFKDRSRLLLAAARSLLEHFQAEVAKPLAQVDDPEARLRARIEGLLRFQMRYPFFHRLVMEEVLPAETPEARALMADMSVRSVSDYHAIMLAGETAGVLRHVDPALLYLSVVGIVEQAAIARPLLKASGHALADDPAYVERFATFIADLLLGGLKTR